MPRQIGSSFSIALGHGQTTTLRTPRISTASPPRVSAISTCGSAVSPRKRCHSAACGSTFNFIFENQLEKLQDGDRFYYLERTAGLAFNAELEGNSFAKLIMANTDATHLPGLVFSTPTWILEVDQTKQYTGLPSAVVLPGPDGILGDDPSTVDIDESADDISLNNRRISLKAALPLFH